MGGLMARKRKRSSSTYRAPRDASVITSPTPQNDFIIRLRSPAPLPRSGRQLQLVEDRRTWSPARHRPYRTPRQVARVLMALPKGKPSSRGSRREVYSFALPKTTVVCVRREIRKQVIHARGVAGSKVRRPRRSAVSRISCRRK